MHRFISLTGRILNDTSTSSGCLYTYTLGSFEHVQDVEPPVINIHGPTINNSSLSVNVHGSTTNISSSTTSNSSVNNNQTCNNTGFPENPNQSSPPHMILNTEGAASVSLKPSVIVKDGVKYKICDHNECQALNRNKNNKLSCTNIKCDQNIRK